MEKISKKVKNLLNSANKIGLIHLMSANLLIQIVGFGGQIFLTRILNVEDIGIIKVYQSYLNILVVFASLGLNTAVLILCSEDINKREQINIFNISLLLTIGCSALIVVVSLFLTNDYLFNAYLFLVPVLCISNLIVIYLQSQQKIKSISYLQSFTKIFIVLFSTIIAYFFGFNEYIYSIIILNIISFLFILPFVKNELRYIKLTKFNISQIKKMKNIASFAFGANLLGVLLININILIATFYKIDIKEIAYLSMAQLLITTMMIIPTTLGQIMIPKFSKISNDKKALKLLFKTYHKKNLLIALSVGITGAILGPIFIPLVFGVTYSKSIYYFELLLISFILWSYFSPKGITLLSIKRSDINFYVSLVSLIINITLNFLLINYLGIIGAVLSTIITNFITVFVNGYYFSKYI